MGAFLGVTVSSTHKLTALKCAVIIPGGITVIEKP